MLRQATIQATEGHRSFGQLLKRVYNSDEHLIVERDGFPVAVLMSFQEYQKLSRQQQAVAAFERFSREFGRDIEQRGLTEEEVLGELKKTRRAVFEETYGRRAG
jgi:prevent-host-death family protein